MHIVHEHIVLWYQTTRVQPVKLKRSKNGDKPNMRHFASWVFSFNFPPAVQGWGLDRNKIPPAVTNVCFTRIAWRSVYDSVHNQKWALEHFATKRNVKFFLRVNKCFRSKLLALLFGSCLISWYQLNGSTEGTFKSRPKAWDKRLRLTQRGFKWLCA